MSNPTEDRAAKLEALRRRAHYAPTPAARAEVEWQIEVLEALIDTEAKLAESQAKNARAELRLIEAGATIARVRAQRDDVRMFRRDDGLRP